MTHECIGPLLNYRLPHHEKPLLSVNLHSKAQIWVSEEVISPVSRSTSTNSYWDPHDRSHLAASAATLSKPKSPDACLSSLMMKARQDRSLWMVNCSQWAQSAPSRTDLACSSHILYPSHLIMSVAGHYEPRAQCNTPPKLIFVPCHFHADFSYSELVSEVQQCDVLLNIALYARARRSNAHSPKRTLCSRSGKIMFT